MRPTRTELLFGFTVLLVVVTGYFGMSRSSVRDGVGLGVVFLTVVLLNRYAKSRA